MRAEGWTSSVCFNHMVAEEEEEKGMVAVRQDKRQWEKEGNEGDYRVISLQSNAKMIKDKQ